MGEMIISNSRITLTVDTLGAQMMSLKGSDGIEYLWQGDPAYWPDRSPNLFPIVGRMTDNRYLCYGKPYSMGLHGFAQSREFAVIEIGESSVTLELHSDGDTKQQYPFDFTFRVTYRLKENTVHIRYEVENRSDNMMPFAIGGHPGFNVPLVSGECFEEYTLEFTQPCQPDMIGFTLQGFTTGCDKVYPLEEEKRIPLLHNLFDEDGIALKNMSREVTLRSNVSGRGVQAAYPGMPYIVFWHAPKTDAPYICIEPWSSLPARQDIIEELTCKSDMIQLPAGDKYSTDWSITIF